MLAESFGSVPWWCWPLALLLVGLAAGFWWDVRKAKVREDWQSSLDTPRGVR